MAVLSNYRGEISLTFDGDHQSAIAAFIFHFNFRPDAAKAKVVGSKQIRDPVVHTLNSGSSELDRERPHSGSVDFVP